MKKSEVLSDNEVTRLDSTYFLRDDQILIDEIRETNWERLTEFCDVTDGIHTSIEFEEGTGIRVISAKHPKEGFFDLSVGEEISAESHKRNPRTALRATDVIISTVGTIGNAAVVTDDMLPANSDRHVGIIRPQPRASNPISSEYLCCFMLSRFGRMQSRRETTGNVQPNLFLDKIRNFMIVRLGAETERLIATTYLTAKAAKDASESKISEAEGLLLGTLGLAGWAPPEPLTYTESASVLRVAGRIDAEYFNPRHLYAENLIASGSFETLGTLAEFVSSGPAWQSDQFTDPDDRDGLPFVRIRNCKPGTIEANELDRLLPGGIAKFSTEMAKPGDIAVGMDGLRWFYAGLLAEAAYINQRVGWVRMATGSPDPNFIQLLINSPLGQAQLLRRMTIANTVGHITLNDIRDIKIPMMAEERQQVIVAKLKESVLARTRSRALLAAAKRAIEIAVEEGETAALAYLAQAEVSTHG